MITSFAGTRGLIYHSWLKLMPISPKRENDIKLTFVSKNIRLSGCELLHE